MLPLITQARPLKRHYRYILVSLGVLCFLFLYKRSHPQLSPRIRPVGRQEGIIDLENDPVYTPDDDDDIPVIRVYSEAPPTAQRIHQLNEARLGLHQFREDGLLEVNSKGRHPIYDLIAHAEHKWEKKLARQSKTLTEAVLEYKRRYQRDPPLGFDYWWNYVQEYDVQLPDEYDQIYRDLEPFWGISPSDMRTLQKEYEAEPGTYTLGNGKRGFGRVRVDAVSLADPNEADIAEERSSMQIDVLQPVSQWIPPFRATFTYHDNPRVFISHDLLAEAVDAAAVQEYIDLSQPWDSPQLGWTSGCAASAPLRRLSQSPNLHESHKKTFIHNHLRSMNPCLHPAHLDLNGQLLNFGKGPSPRQRILPSFSMSAMSLYADILTVAPENWTEDVGVDPQWDDKLYNKLLWRGSTTGMHMRKNRKWKQSQRLRLVALANESGEQHYILKAMSPSSLIGAPMSIRSEVLNENIMDISFSGRAAQCEPDVCAAIQKGYKFNSTRQSWDEANQYKYILDIDGNGWSARFKRLMTTNSLILKATICPEWFSERVMPWVHYVPVQMNLEDLYDIMVFFRGDFSGNLGNDHLAKKIATAGKSWSKTFWRKEDQTVYMFRLFLEWARILSPDRNAMSFLLRAEDN